MLGTGKMLHGHHIHISDYHAVDSSRVLAALMTELVNIAPEKNLFSKLTRDNGSPSGFLKALGRRDLAVPSPLRTGGPFGSRVRW